MPADEQPFLFEELFRGRDAKRTGTPGQGLGLAMAKKIATLHGGTLTIESQPGSGTRATVRLPMKPPGLWQKLTYKYTLPQRQEATVSATIPEALVDIGRLAVHPIPTADKGRPARPPGGYS
jgi:hypothetical protein